MTIIELDLPKTQRVCFALLTLIVTTLWSRRRMVHRPRASMHLLREQGQDGWSPQLCEKILAISLQELACVLGVSEDVLRRRPDDVIVQKRLGAFAEVLDRLLEIRPDLPSAVFHMKNTPIRALNRRTLLEAIREGEHEKALRYLQTIGGGQNG